MEKKIYYLCTVEYFLTIKRRKSCYSGQHGWIFEGIAKWDKSDRKREILYDFTYVVNLESQSQKQKSRLVTCQGLGNGKILVKENKLAVISWKSSGDLI